MDDDDDVELSEWELADEWLWQRADAMYDALAIEETDDD